jgi:hypothetical protein
VDAFSVVPHHAEDLHAWQVLRPLLDQGNYLPWSTGSMRPSGMVIVCNDIVHGSRRSIVECGSGLSTVVWARLLRQRGGGTVTAIEHDRRWAALVSELLSRESLQDIAQVVHAPLAGDPSWYAPEALESLPAEVDLLIVDGPPAYAAGMGLARLPALAALESRLTETATVVLDDVGRPGEQEVLASWQLDTTWQFSVHEATGIATGRRHAAAA